VEVKSFSIFMEDVILRKEPTNPCGDSTLDKFNISNRTLCITCLGKVLNLTVKALAKSLITLLLWLEKKFASTVVSREKTVLPQYSCLLLLQVLGLVLMSLLVLLPETIMLCLAVTMVHSSLLEDLSMEPDPTRFVTFPRMETLSMERLFLKALRFLLVLDTQLFTTRVSYTCSEELMMTTISLVTSGVTI